MFLASILMITIFVLVGVDRIVFAFVLATTHPLFLALFVFTFLVSFLFRATRLRIIVGNPQIAYSFYLRLLFASWFLNVIVPARIGEAAQIALLNSEHEVPIGRAATAIVADKVYDLLALGVLLSSLLVLLEGESNQVRPFGIFVVIAFLVIIGLTIGLLLVALVPQRVSALFEFLFGRWDRVSQALIGVVESANSAVREIVGSKRRLITLFLLSLPIWLCEGSTVFLISQAMGYAFPVAETMTAAVVAFLSMTLPLTPGGFGTYELVMAFTLSLLIPAAHFEFVALPISIVEHLIRQIVILAVGAVAISALGTQLSGILDLARRALGRSSVVAESAGKETKNHESGSATLK